jgi:hypothetical protein
LERRLKTRTTFALALFLALAQPAAPAVGAENTTAPALQAVPATSKDKPASEGEVALTLTKTPDVGYFVRFADGTHTEIYSSCLLSIDGKALRGLGLEQIKALLRGPVGTTASLDFLDEDGQIKTVSARREAKVAGVDNRVNILLQASDSLDRGDPRIANIDFLKDKLDICARAGQNLLVQETEEWPSPKGNLVATAALSAALTNYETGNLPQGDHFMDQLEKAYVPNEPLVCPPERLSTEIIRILLAVGRLEDAEKLAHRLFENRHSGAVLDLDQIACFKTLAESQGRTDKEKALKTASLIEELEKNGMRQEDIEWLADFNLRQGNLAQSGALYQTASATRAHSVTTGRWQTLQPLVMDLYRSALLDLESGDKEEASKVLKTAIEKYKTILTERQIALLEDAPLFFPKLSDLEKVALSLTPSSAPISAFNANSEGTTIEKDQDEDGVDKNDEGELYGYLRAFYEAVPYTPVAKAPAIAARLLQAYSTEPATAGSGGHKPILVCCLATLARRLSDRGRYSYAHDLLTKLIALAEEKRESYNCLVYLNCELVCNDALAKKDTENNWEKFESQYHLIWEARSSGAVPVSPAKDDYSWSERLRRLAMTYFYAGEWERADILMNQATSVEHRKLESISQDAAFYPNPGTLLLLDSALIASRLSGSVDAQKIFKLAHFRFQPSDLAYFGTISQLAKSYESSNYTSKAIGLLDITNTSYGLAGDQGLNRVAEQSRHDYIAAQIDFPLAVFFAKTGREAEALTVLDKAIGRGSSSLSPAILTLAANLAAHEGNWERAANYCNLAAKTDDYGPMRVKTGDYFIPAMLEKGLAFAINVADTDKAKARSLLIQLAETASTSRPMEALKLYQSAQALTPEMSPKKTELQTKIDALVQQMQ